MANFCFFFLFCRELFAETKKNAQICRWIAEFAGNWHLPEGSKLNEIRGKINAPKLITLETPCNIISSILTEESHISRCLVDSFGVECDIFSVEQIER